MRWWPLFVLAVWGCDPAPTPATDSARPATGRTAAPTTGAKPSVSGDDDFELETVDDTIPADDAVVEDAGEAEDDDPDSPCAPKDPSLKPMQLLRFTFADGVEGKDPKSKLNVARAGQRVYAHLAMRNRSGRTRCLHLTFRVGGKKRTEVTLKIGKSWEWRTYAYNTLRADDDEPLELTVTDDQGAVVVKKLLAVIPRKG